jgi:hypothetical protein
MFEGVHAKQASAVVPVARWTNAPAAYAKACPAASTSSTCPAVALLAGWLAGVAWLAGWLAGWRWMTRWLTALVVDDSLVVDVAGI